MPRKKRPENTTDASPAPAGSSVKSRIRVEHRLGGGGMADVFLGWDVALKRKCVLKVPLAATEHRRTLREAEIGALLHGDGAALVFESGVLDDGCTPYIVFEYVDGSTLAERLAQGGALDWPSAVDIVRKILLALAPAHAADIVHRDIKPANIIVRPSGEVRIIDWGLALRAGAPPLTEPDDHVGTARYMSVEQAIAPHAVDARADIYSIGVILYELIAGALPPFEWEDTIERAPSDWPRLPDVREIVPDAPEPIAAVIRKATAHKAEDRYTDIASFIDALDGCTTGEAIVHEPSATPPAAAGVMMPVNRHDKTSIWRAVALVLLALAGTSVPFWPRARPVKKPATLQVAPAPPSFDGADRDAFADETLGTMRRRP